MDDERDVRRSARAEADERDERQQAGQDGAHARYAPATLARSLAPCSSSACSTLFTSCERNGL